MAIEIGDEEKLGELMIYISSKCAGDPRFGATKLNKLLYFSDFFAFGHTGKPITGVEYQHIPNGPAPRRLRPIRDRLVEQRAIAVQENILQNGRKQTRIVPLRKANLSAFTGEEIALVDSLIDKHWNDDANAISEMSHNFVGWKMTKEGENIPYGSIFLSDAPLTEVEIFRGKELARQYGWLL